VPIAPAVQSVDRSALRDVRIDDRQAEEGSAEHEPAIADMEALGATALRPSRRTHRSKRPRLRAAPKSSSMPTGWNAGKKTQSNRPACRMPSAARSTPSGRGGEICCLPFCQPVPGEARHNPPTHHRDQHDHGGQGQPPSEPGGPGRPPQSRDASAKWLWRERPPQPIIGRLRQLLPATISRATTPTRSNGNDTIG